MHINIVEILEASARDYEEAGHGRIYNVPTLTGVFKPFLTNIFEDFNTDDPVIEKSYYDEISELFTSSLAVFGTNLSIAGDRIKQYYSIVSEKVSLASSGIGDFTNKLYLFSQYFLITIDRITSYNATVDSGELLRIIEHYTFSSKRVSAKGYNKSDLLPTTGRSFIDIYRKNILEEISEIGTKAISDNTLISQQAFTQNSLDIWGVSTDVLLYSWGGEGVKLASDLKELYTSAQQVGGTEITMSGGVDYIAQVSNLLNHMCFGVVNAPLELFMVEGAYLFGRFHDLYSVKRTFDRIYGLEFLEPMLTLRSFHTIDDLQPQFANILVQKYYDNLAVYTNSPLYITNTEESFGSYYNILNVALLNLIKECEALYSLSDVMYRSLDEYGTLQNVRGFGNLKYILAMFKEASAMLVKALSHFTSAFDSLVQNVKQASINVEFVDTLIPFILKAQKSIDSFKSTLEVNGFYKTGFVSNIDYTATKKSVADTVSYLTQCGYSSAEVQALAEAKSVEDVLEAFGENLLDSQDLKSFFKSYELAELLYTFGGERATLNFLEFLNNPSASGIKNIYTYLERAIDKYQYIDRYKFGQLIGALLGINKAANFETFSSYASVLKAKNSTILQSVRFLDAIQTDPLASAPDMLTEFISQLPQGTHEYRLGDIDCSAALAKAPIAFKRWLGIFDSALGTANEAVIRGFMNNDFGITINQLNSLFSMDKNTGVSTLGGLISGLTGGNFTQMLRHLKISGILLSANAPRAERETRLYRYEVKSDRFIREFYERTENVSTLMSLVYNRLLLGFNSTAFRTSTATDLAPERSAQQAVDAFRTNYNVTYVYPDNFLSPNSFVLPKEVPDPAEQNTTTATRPLWQSEHMRKFVKSDVFNEISAGITQSTSRASAEYIDGSTLVPTAVTGFDNHGTYPEYKLPLLSVEIESDDFGGYVIKQPTGEVIEEINPTSTDGIPIFRKMYEISNVNPSAKTLVNDYKSPPAYYKVLSGTDGIGENGEPLSLKSISEVGNSGLNYDYAHTRHAISNFEKALKYPIRALKDCSVFENDLKMYIKCANHYRCTKNKQAYGFCK